MRDVIRYGIIGTGMMGLEHIHNINAIEGGLVTALSDPFEGSLADGVKAAAEASDAPASIGAFAHHGELLESGLVDAVVIVSPNFTHKSILDDVLTADVHTLIEKPMCTTVEDCKTVVSLAGKSSKITQVGMEYRYMAPVARMINEVKAGTVGVPQMMAIREHRFPFLEKVGDWNRFSANTGGTLVEKCCHYFDLMNLVIGDKPIRVMASGGQNVNHLDEVYDGKTSDILDNAYVVVEYPGGQRAMLDLCMFAEATEHQEEMSVTGPKGKLEALMPKSIFKKGIRDYHGGPGLSPVQIEEIHDDEIKYEGLHYGSSYLEHIDFLAACRGERPIEVTVEDGLLAVAVGAAAHLSIDEGRVVDLAEFGL